MKTIALLELNRLLRCSAMFQNKKKKLSTDPGKANQGIIRLVSNFPAGGAYHPRI